jgi:hypothetical protein
MMPKSFLPLTAAFFLFSSLAATAQDPTLPARFMKAEEILTSHSLPVYYEESLDLGKDAPRVKYSIHRERGSIYIQFVPERDYQFIPYSAYHSVFRIPINQGEIDQVKVFTSPKNPKTFIRIKRQGQLSSIQWILEGYELERSVPLVHSLEELITVGWDQLPRLYPDALPWDLVFPEYRRSNAKVQAMAREIEQALIPIPEVEDGALDAWGQYVNIADGLPQKTANPGFNCSGMVKWVADGVLGALSGRTFTLEELKLRQLEERDDLSYTSMESLRDPFFGFDWVRNIAQGLFAAMERPPRVDDAEVTGFPWLSYVENRGYPIEGLASILYHEAVRQPGYWYLASISGEFGRAPVLIQHRHVTTLFPYFDKEGLFQLRVFDVNEERSLQSLIDRFQGHRVYLLRVPAMEGLSLPDLRPSTLSTLP